MVSYNHTTSFQDRSFGNPNRRILVKKENNNNILVSNTQNNKIVINGTKSNLESEKATLNVNGSLSLKDFLMLKVSDQSDVELSNSECIIWLEEDGNGEPELKIKFKNSGDNVKTGTINLSESNH